MTDVELFNHINISQKQQKKLEKYQDLRGVADEVGSEDNSGPLVNGALEAVSPKLKECLQQMPGTSECSVKKSAVIGAAKTMCRSLRLSGLWERAPA